MFEYDAAGRLVRETDRRGNLSSHEYDARNRRTRTAVYLDRVTSPSREVVTESRYDLAGNRVGVQALADRPWKPRTTH